MCAEFEDLACRRNRLREDRRFIGNRIWHRVQITRRQPEHVSKRTVIVQNTQYAPLAALRGNAPRAQITRAAGHVDLPYHTPPDPLLRATNHVPDELMTKHPREMLIALHEFQVGAANPAQPQPDQHLVSLRHRPRASDHPQRTVKHDRSFIACHHATLSFA